MEAMNTRRSWIKELWMWKLVRARESRVLRSMLETMAWTILDHRLADYSSLEIMFAAASRTDSIGRLG